MKSLNRYQQDYNESGYIYPVNIISIEEAKKHREIIENTEKESEDEDSLFGRFLNIFSDDSKEKVE